MSGENIQGVQILECADDAEVILKAAALLDAHPEHQNIEVRDGKRMVARVPRKHESSGEPRPNSLLSIVRGDAKKDGE